MREEAMLLKTHADVSLLDYDGVTLVPGMPFDN